MFLEPVGVLLDRAIITQFGGGMGKIILVFGKILEAVEKLETNTFSEEHVKLADVGWSDYLL